MKVKITGTTVIRSSGVGQNTRFRQDTSRADEKLSAWGLQTGERTSTLDLQQCECVSVALHLCSVRCIKYHSNGNASAPGRSSTDRASTKGISLHYFSLFFTDDAFHVVG